MPKGTEGHKGERGDDSQSEFLWYFTKERLRIYAFIYSLLHDQTDAEDVFQQTSVTLWKKFSEFDSNRDFYSWACGVAIFDVQNFRRLAVHRRLRFDDALVQQLADEQTNSAREGGYRIELLEECITHLSEEDRLIVTQVYRNESAIDEVAEKMNRAKQTVYNRLNLIRNNLLKCIERKMEIRSTT